ncbi:MAG: transcriptional repressor [Zetaproteobacteria bacterium CG_4_9_14_3_um_filter_53_7]|nr:MAG: transcriptional repressor [Zetaproteobacteria bacterium CG_4_9_14_3_um_filter_53_7]
MPHITLLRDHGLRITPQRLAISALLLAEPAHSTPQQVYETLRHGFPALSLNTVYLTLAQFESSGLLQRFQAGGRTIFDSNTAPHDHVCCTVCGMISDIQKPDRPQLPLPLSQWKISGESHTWTGICPDCLARQNQ